MFEINAKILVKEIMKNFHSFELYNLVGSEGDHDTRSKVNDLIENALFASIEAIVKEGVKTNFRTYRDRGKQPKTPLRQSDRPKK